MSNLYSIEFFKNKFAVCMGEVLKAAENIRKNTSTNITIKINIFVCCFFLVWLFSFLFPLGFYAKIKLTPITY